VEILFPSNTQSYMAGKLADYRQIGVRECWLVPPKLTASRSWIWVTRDGGVSQFTAWGIQSSPLF
jgi:Uma2 family endonuclease